MAAGAQRHHIFTPVVCCDVADHIAGTTDLNAEISIVEDGVPCHGASRRTDCGPSAPIAEHNITTDYAPRVYKEAVPMRGQRSAR